MLSILIVDDTPEKITAIQEFVKNSGISTEPVIVNDLRKAIKEMGEHLYDLVILDLNIPNEWGRDSNPQNAITLMELIHQDEELLCPMALIGLTCLEDIKQYQASFDKFSLQLLRYELNDDTWKTPLKNKIKFLIKYKRKMTKEKRQYKYDVAIINALQEPENTQVQKVFGDNWKLIEMEDDKTNTYYETTVKDVNGHDVSIVTAFMSQMAGVSSATLTTKVIYNFAPRYIFMTGIAAGINQEDESYGDILICSEVWDGASGKIKTDGQGLRKFEPDYRPLAIDTELKNICMQMKADKNLFNNIENNYPTNNGKPKTHLQVHIGPMASVPAVTARKEEIDAIKEHARKIIGIEMESYGMFYAVSNGVYPRPKFCAAFKSVSDFADVAKADDYQEYASYTSAAFLKELICKKLNFNF